MDSCRYQSRERRPAEEKSGYGRHAVIIKIRNSNNKEKV
jgi:hypothetical protein